MKLTVIYASPIINTLFLTKLLNLRPRSHLKHSEKTMESVLMSLPVDSEREELENNRFLQTRHSDAP